MTDLPVRFVRGLRVLSGSENPGLATSGWRWLLSIVLPLLVLSKLGQDNNWDLHNYHLYNPHAWWHGRMATDIAVAQLQSFHNPLLDLPLYLLVSAGAAGWLVSLWLCLPFMLALNFLLRLQARSSEGTTTRWDALVLAVLASLGAGASIAIGTSFNDAFVAAAVLGALCLLLDGGESSGHQAWRWCAAGVVMGAIAGLKLTAAVYCLGFAGAALVAFPVQRSPKRLLALSVGGLAGFALTYGWWGWWLYQSHGNPVFPYFNQWFQSPDALPISHADLRFRPDSITDLLMVPLRLLRDTQRYSELLLRDPRLLLGILSLAMLWIRAGKRSVGPESTARLRLLSVFFLASLLVWALQYGIYRYLLPLEMLSCLAVCLCLAWLPTSERYAISLLLLVLAVAATNAQPMGRTRFGQPMAGATLPVLPAHSMVVISGSSPVGMAAARLPDDVPAVSVFNNFMRPEQCTGIQVRASQRLLGHTGPLWLLRDRGRAGDEGERLLSSHYGLRVGSNCYPVASGGDDLVLCQLQREQVKAACIVTGEEIKPRP